MEDNKKETIDAEVVGEETKKESTNNTNESLVNVINTIDNLPLWAKILLALPGVDVCWHIYRIFRSAIKKNTTGIVLAVVLIIVSFSFWWIIDMLCIAFNGKVWWID